VGRTEKAETACENYRVNRKREGSHTDLVGRKDQKTKEQPKIIAEISELPETIARRR